MVLRSDRFAGVTWDPWWRERKSADRRKTHQRSSPERRSSAKAGHRLSSDGESVQPLRLVHDRRGNWKRQNGSERRKRALHERLVDLAAFVRGLGKTPLSEENARLLVRICAGLTTRETYERWKQTSSMATFFRDQTATKERITKSLESTPWLASWNCSGLEAFIGKGQTQARTTCKRYRGL